jgi:hypothetical protein
MCRIIRINVTIASDKGKIGVNSLGACHVMSVQEAKTLSVPQAGRDFFDLGKNASYEAAKRGEIPVIKIGGRLRVPVIALERMLEAAFPLADGERQCSLTKPRQKNSI